MEVIIFSDLNHYSSFRRVLKKNPRLEFKLAAASSLEFCKSCCDGLHFKEMLSIIIGAGVDIRRACYGKIFNEQLKEAE